MRENARKHVVEAFGIEQFNRKFVEMIETLLK
jgi:hypothetical protein